VAFVSAQAGRHQQDRRPNPLAAARLDVLADARDQLDLRLDVPREFSIDLLEVGPNRLEDLRERRRRLWHGSAANFITAGTGCESSRSCDGPSRYVRRRAVRPGSRAPATRAPARCACRDAAPARERDCRFRSAADRSAPAALSRAAPPPLET